MRYITSLIFIITIISSNAYSQKKTGIFNFKDKKDIYDTLGNYVIFNNRLILYADMGSIFAPFIINFKDESVQKHSLSYRINHGIIFGIGGSYKGIGLRLNYMVVKNIEKKVRYGETNYIGLQMRFPIVSIYSEITFYRFKGYSITKANIKIPDYTLPNMIRGETSNLFIEFAGSYFFNKNFDVKALVGKAGHYTQKQYSSYAKPSIGYFNIANKSGSIIPNELLTEYSTTQNNTNKINSFFIGGIPGFAYVTRLKNWQFSGMIGIGFMMQLKSYQLSNNTRNFMGISPKIDTQIDLGYNPDDWFIILSSEIKYSQLGFSHFLYNGIYSSIRLTGGYRFKIMKKVKK